MNELKQKWVNEHLGRLKSQMINYLDRRYHYVPGLGLAKLPVIRELVAHFEKSQEKKGTEERQRIKEPTKQEQTQAK